MPLPAGLDQILGYVRRGKRILYRVLAVWLTAFAGFTVLPIFRPTLFYHLLSPDWLNHSVALTVFRWLEEYLLPAGETLIAAGPFDAFMLVMYVGAGLAFLVTVPYATYLMFRVFRVEVVDEETGTRLVGSLLEERQRRWVRTLGLLSVVFFFFGTGFGLWVLPSLYDFAYTFQLTAGVAGTITLDGFLGTTMLLTLGLGLLFEIPTVAYGLALAGAVESATLSRHWRAAGGASFVVAFLISPGVGLGLIEVPIALLLFGLYILSYYIVRGVERRRLPSPSGTATAVTP